MAQVPKAHIREAVVDAALTVFADVGFERATMQRIGDEAGVSASNVYRYFASKEALLEAALPRAHVRTLLAEVRASMSKVGLARSLSRHVGDRLYRSATDGLLSLVMRDRRALVFLMLHAEGTVHRGFRPAYQRLLVKNAVVFGRQVNPHLVMTVAKSRALEQIYRAFVITLFESFRTARDERAVRDANQQLSAYHLAGLRAFFALPA